MPIFGLKNPLVVAFLAPAIGFLLVLTLFKCAALAVHKKLDGWYKYKVGDTQRLLWERLNSRVGLPLGLANAVVYVFIFCTLIYALGYLSVQVANSENDSCISGNSSTRGLIISSTAVRSAFFAQPGNARLRKLRARRTRLLITTWKCGPSPRSHSPPFESTFANFTTLPR